MTMRPDSPREFSFGIVHKTLTLAFFAALLGCNDGDDQNRAGIPVPSPRSGGDTTSANRTSSAFEDPAPNLDDAELEAHIEGDAAFEASFVASPAEVNQGLGPVFNNTACNACHIANGRGQALIGEGALGSQALVRVSVSGRTENGGPAPFGEYGTQLQDHAILGHSPEAHVEIAWVVVEGEYADGTPYELQRPDATILLAGGAPLPNEVMTSLRIPPVVFGLGLLEAVPEQTLLSLADPDDQNGDGISGRVNRVWSAAREATVVGRFGWKANTATLVEQTAGAYLDDMGISNPIHTADHGVLDIDRQTLDAATFYTQTLAVPPRRELNEAGERGARLFVTMGCADCHVAELQTGEHEIAAISFQRIVPYSDLLLHDMGPDLTDNRPDFEATGAEWRTPPLWGIGLARNVLGVGAFLHDGRARTLEEAVLWHGGEAEAAREAFRTTDAAERAALVAFLEAL